MNLDEISQEQKLDRNLFLAKSFSVILSYCLPLDDKTEYNISEDILLHEIIYQLVSCIFEYCAYDPNVFYTTGYERPRIIDFFFFEDKKVADVKIIVYLSNQRHFTIYCSLENSGKFSCRRLLNYAPKDHEFISLGPSETQIGSPFFSEFQNMLAQFSAEKYFSSEQNPNLSKELREEAVSRFESNLSEERWAVPIGIIRDFLFDNTLDLDIVRKVASLGITAFGSQIEFEKYELSLGEAYWRHQVKRHLDEANDTFGSKDIEELSSEVFGIGHNNPPDDIDLEEESVPPPLLLWEPVEELRREASSSSPNVKAVEKAVGVLRSLIVASGKWLMKRGEVAADELVKWGVRIGIATVLAKPETLEAAKKLLELATKWLEALKATF